MKMVDMPQEESWHASPRPPRLARASGSSDASVVYDTLAQPRSAAPFGWTTTTVKRRLLNLTSWPHLLLVNPIWQLIKLSYMTGDAGQPMARAGPHRTQCRTVFSRSARRSNHAGRWMLMLMQMLM